VLRHGNVPVHRIQVLRAVRRAHQVSVRPSRWGLLAL
jgi:hypothetical protein